MVIVVFDVSGNCRTCSRRAAMPPIKRMSRLTTLASTGRRMKRSVKAFIGFSSRPGRFRRTWKRGRFVESDRRIGLELDLAGGHYALARPQAFLDRNPLAARRADPNEAPLDDEAAHAAIVADAALLARMGRRGDDEDIVAVETVDDRGARQRQHGRGFAGGDGQIGEHT